MYARVVESKTLNFGVSGKLWNRSLVMYDRETETLWSHLLGRGMEGELEGIDLELIPSVMTDWETWYAQHPASTVLNIRRTSRQFAREKYRPLSDYVLGIAEGPDAKSWAYDKLVKDLALQDKWLDRPVLVTFVPRSVTARLFDRTLNDRVLDFEIRDGTLTDQQTGSTWDPVVGRATKGPLAGRFLEALPAIASYKKAWFAFHPNSK